MTERPIVPEYEAVRRPVPVSVVAMASAVLGAVGVISVGLFGWVVMFPALVLGVGCGVVGLRRTRHGERRGRGEAVGGLVFSGLGIVLFVLIWVPEYRAGQRYAQAGRCRTDMLEIGKALIAYAEANHRQFPASLGVVLRPGVIRASRDAGERASYIYLGRGLSYPHAGPSLSDTVLMYEPLNNRHGGGINVLFADGHVEHLFPKEVLARLAAGRNPPGAGTRP